MDTLKIFLLISAFFIVACSGDNAIEVKDKEGNLVEKYTTNKEALKHGIFNSYYKDGSIHEEANYVDGQLAGTRKLYKENGDLEIEEFYENGVLSGEYKVFHPNGEVNLLSNYVNGTLQGILKEFWSDGQIKAEVTFVDNEENGPFKEYYPNGKVEWDGNYLNGDNEFGLLKNYSEDGKLIKKMMCDSLAVCQTIWTLEKGDIAPKY